MAVTHHSHFHLQRNNFILIGHCAEFDLREGETQGRPQAGARGCTCTLLDFVFQNLLFTFYSSDQFSLPGTIHAHCTESVTVSFLQSEIQQQVLVFHELTLDRYTLHILNSTLELGLYPLQKMMWAPMVRLIKNMGHYMKGLGDTILVDVLI